MHFLYQIVTSAFIYSLYEEEGDAFLHVLNLSTKRSRDIMFPVQILDILTLDPEVSPENCADVEKLLKVYRIR